MMRTLSMAAKTATATPVAASERPRRPPAGQRNGESNQALQAKLKIGRTDDPLEREADQAAETVVAGDVVESLGSAPARPQRACAACAEEDRTLRRQVEEEEEEEEEMRMKPASGGPNPVGADVAAAAVAAGGRPLGAAERAYFEPRFGRDFSGVRIHDGSHAHAAATAINARAFTLGSDIAFAAGSYAPATRDGRRLLAHELAHTVQQAGRAGAETDPVIRRQPVCGTSAPETNVDVWVVELPGASRSASTDVSRANTIWQQCGVNVNLAGGETWQTNLLDQDAPTGVLNAPSSTTRPLTDEENAMLAHKPGGDSAVHAYSVPDFSGPKVGEAFWPSFHGERAFAINNAAITEVFAHELGHVLLDTGGHEPNGSNVMARNIQSAGGGDLRCDQCP